MLVGSDGVAWNLFSVTNPTANSFKLQGSTFLGSPNWMTTGTNNFLRIDYEKVAGATGDSSITLTSAEFNREAAGGVGSASISFGQSQVAAVDSDGDLIIDDLDFCPNNNELDTSVVSLSIGECSGLAGDKKCGVFVSENYEYRVSIPSVRNGVASVRLNSVSSNLEEGTLSQIDSNTFLYLNEIRNDYLGNPSSASITLLYQVDSDNDGVGDVCDQDAPPVRPVELDGDADGVADVLDICPLYPNPDQVRSDKNNNDIPDECEGSPFYSDEDRDSIMAVNDNCPNDFNHQQRDVDEDGIGDVCDLCIGDNSVGDSDGDGFCDDRGKSSEATDGVVEEVDETGASITPKIPEDGTPKTPVDESAIGEVDGVSLKDQQLLNRMRFVFVNEEGFSQKAKIAGATFCYFNEDCVSFGDSLDKSNVEKVETTLSIIGQSLSNADTNRDKLFGIVSSVRGFYSTK
jgi:hypothetical protein